MFSVCRGPASISRVFRAAAPISRVPSTGPSALSVSLQCTRKPLESRWLHVYSALSSQAAAARQRFAEDGSIAQPEQFRDITKFQELIDQDMVHANVIEEITKGMGHHTMTEVQTMTINQGLQGTDM